MYYRLGGFFTEVCMRRFADLGFLIGCVWLGSFAPALYAQGSLDSTLYEGARLILGDGKIIENSAFIVENGQFVAVGKKGTLKVPPEAAHVNLTGKTVMPTMVDLHGHLGYQNIPAGTMSKETFTRDNLVDHLQRLAYYGIGAVVDVASLVDRSDMHGGRTNWGDVPLRVRDDVFPGAALFKTAGVGIAAPGGGPIGHPSRADVPYPVSTPEEARAAVDDYVRIKPSFIKIWVDDRSGTKPKLSPALLKAITDEAHRMNVPVAAHNVTLADAKELMRDGVEGWLHVPVRGGDVVDDELIKIVRDRIFTKDRPNMWMTPALAEPWMTYNGSATIVTGKRPAWLDDPLLRDTYSDAAIKQFWGDPLAKMSPEEAKKAKDLFDGLAQNAMKLRAAGIKVVMGTDTGQSRFFIGYSTHMDLEGLVAMGLTPGEAIVAATSEAARIAQFNTGLIAKGRSADFIVLDANPLDSISNTRKINMVFLRGSQVPRTSMRAKWKSQFK
jgi:imidazolonepropionase-like amidohydrolase